MFVFAQPNRKPLTLSGISAVAPLAIFLSRTRNALWPLSCFPKPFQSAPARRPSFACSCAHIFKMPLTEKSEPMMNGLPVAAVMEDLMAALARDSGAVLQAPPGAGKTTLVPLALLDQPWLAGRRILMLAPRRLAARAAAGRMADLLGESVGHTVGYSMRMERRIGLRTRIEVVTEGVLTRRLQTDSALTDVGLVIFDEFHERSLQADLGLSLCMDIQGVLNADLRLLVMSATLDSGTVAAFLGNVPVISCRGRTYPVETRYGAQRRRSGLEGRVAAVVRKAADAHDMSILVFLPGAAEIGRVARKLRRTDLGKQWVVAPLFGRLSMIAQNRAIAPAPAGKRKIVLASAIAETSLTIEGIGVVVDSGFMRVPRFDLRSGMTRLVTLPVTRASADQRRGRAGRTAPGLCYRLWSRFEHDALRPENEPEIKTADMTALALELALWGIPRPSELQWLDAPPQAAFREAVDLLRTLDAVDNKGRITFHGRLMAALPVHPRLAHMILKANQEAFGRLACDLAALLSERDVIRFDRDLPEVDLQLRLDCLEIWRSRGKDHLAGVRVDPAAARRVVRSAASLGRKLESPPEGRQPERSPNDALGRLLAWAYPDRIAQRRTGGQGRFLLTNGRGAYLDPRAPLADKDYLVAAELDGNRRDARIFLAVSYDRHVLLEQFPGQLEWRTCVAWSRESRRVVAERRRCLGALVVQSEPLSAPDLHEIRDALLQGIRHHGLECLPWTAGLRAWQARVVFLHRVMGAPWPDISDDALAATLEAWLAPSVTGLTRLRDLAKIDLGHALRGQLDWRQLETLERLAPARIKVPSGRLISVDYSGDPPILAVKLQEMFGQTETPLVAGGLQPVAVHLLSPAGRPVQITQDLAGFWQTGYNDVRKELRGRYPKHYWPENPLAAQATHRVKPRKN